MLRTKALFIALLCCAVLPIQANTTYAARKDTVRNDPNVGQDSLSAEHRPTGSSVYSDSTQQHKLFLKRRYGTSTTSSVNLRKIGFNAKHDSRQEKDMKEPWIGDFLKDILFR